jgi:hypothetical protein
MWAEWAHAWEYSMKRLALVAMLALFAEPVVAMPVAPMATESTISKEGPIVSARYGHWRRVTRRTVRRHDRRWY